MKRIHRIVAVANWKNMSGKNETVKRLNSCLSVLFIFIDFKEIM